MWAMAMLSGVSPRNGTLPVSISYSTTVSAYTSVAAPSSPPAACSGAMYDGVPTARPVPVSRSLLASMYATPKSANTSRPSSSSRTLLGLISRWMMPRACE